MSTNTLATTRRKIVGGALAAAALPFVVHGKDGPTARDFSSMLPRDLRIEDFGGNEKIVHLPRKLTEEGSGPFGNERPGDLCYFKPWGNLALFYDDYRWNGLIRLGRFDGGFEPLLVRGTYPVRIERI